MRINIYLTPEETTQLNAISHKYAVSKSTIAVNVLFLLTKYLIREGKTELREQLGKEYLHKKMGKKTCIKPGTAKHTLNDKFNENPTKAYTNALWIYLNKELKNYLTSENITNFHNDLNTALQKTNEPNWDYNHFVRLMSRYQEKK